jgi:galactose mutarotase-like enzyme
VVPERGGLVCGWRCGGREILYLDRERFADPALSVRGGIPVLFPICGDLPDGRLPLPQGDFRLPQHGFARDLPWRLEPLEDGSGRSGVAMELVHAPETLARYPFRFRLRLTFALEPSALAIRARLVHAGPPEAPPMPFSLGLHPYLAVEDPSRVRLEGLPRRCRDQRTGDEVDTAAALRGLAAGVDLLCGPPPGPVRLVDEAAGRAVMLETRAPLDLVVLWTDPPRPMVCLEPWTGPRGALLAGERRLELPPGAATELACRYRVEAA